MSQTLQEVMTPNPVTLPAATALSTAAVVMAEQGIGDVIVETDGSICGLITDRDIVVRAIAAGLDPQLTSLGDVCSRDLITLGPTDTVDEAVALMRSHAIRRLPVTQDGSAVGVVSIGDLAVDRDPDSALADISTAPDNN